MSGSKALFFVIAIIALAAAFASISAHAEEPIRFDSSRSVSPADQVVNRVREWGDSVRLPFDVDSHDGRVMVQKKIGTFDFAVGGNQKSVGFYIGGRF